MLRKLFVVALVGSFLVACGPSQQAKDDFNVEEESKKDDELVDEAISLPMDQVVMLLNSVPPPLELAVLMKDVGGEYSSDPLNPTGNADAYSTSYKKAINLGVYGADLGYANIYSQTQDAIDYLTTVQGLADDLGVGQFFDFETIKELAQSADNLNELLNLTTKNYEKMNDYLKEKGRVNQSVLMMAGGWIEGLHVACYVAENHDSQELLERIGEQKITLAQIMPLLEMFQKDKDISQLHADMKKLEKVFDKVKIEIEEGEPVTIMEDGLEITEIPTTQVVKITPELLKEIKETNEMIRAKFVK